MTGTVHSIDDTGDLLVNFMSSAMFHVNPAAVTKVRLLPFTTNFEDYFNLVLMNIDQHKYSLGHTLRGLQSYYISWGRGGGGRGEGRGGGRGRGEGGRGRGEGGRGRGRGKGEGEGREGGRRGGGIAVAFHFSCSLTVFCLMKTMIQQLKQHSINCFQQSSC